MKGESVSGAQREKEEMLKKEKEEEVRLDHGPAARTSTTQSAVSQDHYSLA